MSRRRKNNTSLTGTIIVGLIIISIYIAIFWVIVYICLIGLAIFLIYLLIKFIVDKITSKNNLNKKNSMTLLALDDIHQNPILTSETQANNKTFNDDIVPANTKQIISTPFDHLFTNIIKVRGINYYQNNKVKNYSCQNNTCTADIIGTEKYKTSITLRNNNIVKASCTCPYYSDNQKYCKHLYALLITYCEKEKILGYQKEEIKQTNYQVDTSLYDELLDIRYEMSDIIDNTEDYYDNLDDTFEIEKTYSEIMEYEDKIKEYEHLTWDKVTENTIHNAKQDLSNLQDLYDEFEQEIDNLKEEKRLEIEEKNQEAMLLGSLFASGLEGNEENESDDRNSLKSIWGLDDNEADLVASGSYDPWNFEEGSYGEELDEDDYYADDDF